MGLVRSVQKRCNHYKQKETVMKDCAIESLATAQRRRLLQATGALALMSVSPLGFAEPAGRKIKIGYVTPQTGPLAGFGESDQFVLNGIKWAFKNGIVIGDKSIPLKFS